MFKAYTVGRLFGVEIRLHSTLLFLLGFVALSSLFSAGPGAALGSALTLTFVLFCVTLHELGHIGAARLFGIGTTGVTLYPFGGIARLDRDARTPTEEIVVALAGPAVNVALVALAAIPMAFVGPVEPLLTFFGVNVALAVFNLVPAYPMDGGRVLRGGLWSFVGVRKATRWAARAGQGFAALFFVLGLFWSPMLLVIGVLIFMQATAELKRLDLLERFPAQPRPRFVDAWGRPVRPRVHVDAWGRPLDPGRPRAWVPRQRSAPRPAPRPKVVATVRDPWQGLREQLRRRGVARHNSP